MVPLLELATPVSRIVPAVVAEAPERSWNVKEVPGGLAPPFNVLMTRALAWSVLVYVQVTDPPAGKVMLAVVVEPDCDPPVLHTRVLKTHCVVGSAPSVTL